MTINRTFQSHRFLRIIQLCSFFSILLVIFTVLAPVIFSGVSNRDNSAHLVEKPTYQFVVNTVTDEKYYEAREGTRYTQRGQYWVLKNYIRAEKIFSANESITFTTHGEYNYLDNLIPLLNRWNGPISISVYTPGIDFAEALLRILYLRECSESSSLVKEFVSFHFYFESKYFPKFKIPQHPSLINLNCSSTTAPIYTKDLKSFKNLMRLTYPINIGRNVAREMATTNYVLAADIELYPSPKLISTFLDMIKINSSLNNAVGNPKVFAIPIFEVEHYITRLPDNKHELIHLMNNGSAVTFHHHVCDYCHRIPKQSEWISAPITDTLNVFHTEKRQGDYVHWEPIFIAYNDVPFYDERLNREGLRDKMTQGFTLCLLNYDFHILDNAFLIHRPGVRRNANENPKSKPLITKQNKVIDQNILPEIKRLFGNSNNCQA